MADKKNQILKIMALCLVCIGVVVLIVGFFSKAT